MIMQQAITNEAQVNYLTTKQAAKELGITAGRVRQLILAGRLPAIKVGRDLLINPADLDKVRDRKTGYPKGRPRKPKGEQDNG